MDTAKAWDEASDKFNTYKKKAYAGAMDNVLTVWPVFLEYINKRIKNKKGLRALEYGCGTGMFCKELVKMGLNTTGVDISPKMIKVGKHHLGKQMEFLVGDYKKALANSKSKGNFNVVCGIMVFQFVLNIQNCFNMLAKSMERQGHIIFAVHDPKILEVRNIKNNFRAGGTGQRIPIYIRDAKTYDKIFKSLKFKKTLEKHIDYSPKFLQQYGRKLKKKTPKYLILGYQKI